MVMMTTMQILISNMGRAIRADVRSKDLSIPVSQRDFHAGRREAYLQNVAQICGLEVKDIRESVLSQSLKVGETVRNTPFGQHRGTVTGRIPRNVPTVEQMMEDD